MTVREGYEVRVTVNCVACDFAVFDRWSAPGHLFHGSDQKQESFIVSGDASISLVPKSVLPTTICVPPSRFNENFTLSVEGRGTSVDPYYAGEVFMGHEVTSPPNEPVLVSYEYTGPQLPPLILSPFGYKSQDSSGHTCNYETEVWLAEKEVLNVLYPRLDIMEHDTVTHRATSNIGWPVIRNGALFTDYHDDFLTRVTLAQQPVDPVTGCRTSPGLMSWLLDFVDLPINFAYFGNNAGIDCASGKVTVEHKFKRMLILTLESQGEEGYAVADPAKKYYAEPFGENPVYEQVTITAKPLPGFEFTHWSGDGECYPNGTSQPAVALDGCEIPTITIEMCSNKEVVPNFKEGCFATLAACVFVTDTTCNRNVILVHGHAWIEITENTCGGQASYSITSDINEYPADSGVYTYISGMDIGWPTSPGAKRHYRIGIRNYRRIMDYIAQYFGDDKIKYSAIDNNCAHFTVRCISLGTGENLCPTVPYLAPKTVCFSIQEKEAEEPTSLENPKMICNRNQ